MTENAFDNKTPFVGYSVVVATIGPDKKFLTERVLKNTSNDPANQPPAWNFDQAVNRAETLRKELQDKGQQEGIKVLVKPYRTSRVFPK